jgi:hypothetical protein
MKRYNFENFIVQNLNPSRPYSYNLGEANKKKLTIKNNYFNEEYYILHAAYRTVFQNILLKNLPLKKYDDEIKNNELNFLKKAENHKNIYQKYDVMQLNYIYLRNNIHIERLSRSNIDLIKECIDKKEINITKELVDMVKETYKEVIKIKNVNDINNDLNIIYEVLLFGNKVAPSDALIFEIATEPQLDKNGIVSQNKENLKQDYIYDLKQRMEIEIKKVLNDINIIVFVEKI